MALGAGVAAGAYATWAGLTWVRYGHPPPPAPDERDFWLDTFMPSYDVVERHQIRVAAPADVTLTAARDMDLFDAPAIRAIFKARELLLGSTPSGQKPPKTLVDQMLALGWGILSETPGRELVAGAVTKPWEANVTFRAIAPDAFAAFREPDYVKIVWTLRADPVAPGESIFRTETRSVATDAGARTKFRRYWSLLSPGIYLIRWLSLAPLKAEAERRVEEGRAHPGRAAAETEPVLAATGRPG